MGEGLLQTLTEKQIKKWLPKRSPKAHKGSVGRIYIIAGSKGMVGAGLLCAWGAVRSGAGLVRLGTTKSQQSVAAKRGPLEITTQALPETTAGTMSEAAFGEIQKTWDHYQPHVLVVGPGLGESPSVQLVVNKIISQWKGPLVLDADGLNALAKKPNVKRKGPWVCTPHPGEMARLLKTTVKKVQASRVRAVTEAAKKYKCVCVLKGAGTLIAYGGKVYKNPTGNAGLATGGTGDVLSGMIGAFWGQTKLKSFDEGFASACQGVYLHGLAGEEAAKQHTQVGMVASDVVNCIPNVLKRLKVK